MNSQKKFKNDLLVGRLAEQQLINWYNGCGLRTTPVDVSSEKRNFWDLETLVPPSWRIPSNLLTTEVKYDLKERDTGNIAIEVGNSKLQKDSGIKSSRSLLWAHVLTDTIWLCRTSDLLIFAQHVSPYREFTKAGDGNAHILVYKSRDILPTIFHRVDKLSKADALALIKNLCHIKR